MPTKKHERTWIDHAATYWYDPAIFSRQVLRMPLRNYQLQVARAIMESVLRRQGLTFAVLMSRQAGKNELAAQLEVLFLLLHEQTGGFVIKAAPTFQPQTVNSLLRLQARLQNPSTAGRWRVERGYMICLGQARVVFYSAQPGAAVVGATASILLEADEAQDIPEDKWDKEFRPMGASTNVTTVLWGTPWTADTLLAHAVRALRAQEALDGRRRVFTIPWQRVAAEVPAYRTYVEGEIVRLGARHPLIRTQYALEEIEAAAGLFPPERQARMQGTHRPHLAPLADALYALCVDVAGQAAVGETSPAATEARDCTACTLLAVEALPGPDPLAGRPCYRVVGRYWWRGVAQTDLYARLVQLVERWALRSLVIDATGLGAGLASFMERRYGERVRPFVFTTGSKSQLGWDFLALCDTGRFLDHVRTGDEAQEHFWRQVAAAEYRLETGPGRRLQWGAPPGGHDDLLVSAALCAALEDMPWSCGDAQVIAARDVVEEIDEEDLTP
jgi:hypothetical protein